MAHGEENIKKTLKHNLLCVFDGFNKTILITKPQTVTCIMIMILEYLNRLLLLLMFEDVICQ
jgi:hypothetical protein